MRAKMDPLEVWYDEGLQAWRHNVQCDYLTSPMSSKSVSISFVNGEPICADVVAHGSWIDYNLRDTQDRQWFAELYGELLKEAQNIVTQDIKKRI